MIKDLTTFVFFDIETTGLPDLEANRTKITEFAFVACSKNALRNHDKGPLPRVMHKLTACVNPSKRISLESSRITGLDNYNLEHEKCFSVETAKLIESFFNQLQGPICLVAHNGLQFDYPILRKQMESVDVPLDNIFCVDSLEIFRDIANGSADAQPSCSTNNVSSTTVDVPESECSGIDALLNCEIRRQQEINEKTPSSRKIKAEQGKILLQEIGSANGVRVGTKSKRVLFPSDEPTPTPSKKRVSMKLTDTYERFHGVQPAVAHNAEEDALILMKCFLKVKDEFIERAEKSAQRFMEVKPIGMR